MLNNLHERSVGRIGLICADGLKGLEDVISEVLLTGGRNYTVEQAWGEWQRLCAKWGKYYRGKRGMVRTLSLRRTSLT